MSNLSHAFNYKPITMIGIVSSLHTLIYGLGYSLQESGFVQTFLYQEVSVLMDPQLFGVILTIIGALGIFSYLYGKTALVASTNTAQAFVWLFAGFVYLLAGSPALAVAFGMSWAFINAYCGYMYRRRNLFIADTDFERDKNGRVIL